MPDTELAADWLFSAVEKVLAPAADVIAVVTKELKAYRNEHGPREGKLPHSARSAIAARLVASYASTTANVGAASAMTGIVPGIGTVIATCGGAAADAALSMKYEVDMVRALAYLYGHDLNVDQTKWVAYFVCGLGAAQDGSQDPSKLIDPQAAVRLARRGLDNFLRFATRELFKKLGAMLTRKALQKAIPFGIGMAFGYVVNRTLTNRVGQFAIDYFEAEKRTPTHDDGPEIRLEDTWLGQKSTHI
jgi:hypothetical protein